MVKFHLNFMDVKFLKPYWLWYVFTKITQALSKKGI